MTQGERAVPTRWIRFRIAFVLLVLFGLLGVVGWRAHRLQLVDGPQLREMAEQQYLRNIRLPSRRGTIFDRSRSPLAISIDVDSVYANPRMIGSQAPQVARALAPILEMDAKEIERKLRSRRYFRWIKRRVGDKEAAQVKKLGIRGIFLQKETRRFYPNRGLGATVVGFSGLDARGLEGIELSLGRWLRGGHVKIAALRDARGEPLLTQGVRDAPNMSHDVVLTVDKVIQYETEQALAEALEKHKPKWAAAVVLDVRNGDVLAMASAPSFDPNHYGRYKAKRWRNRTITDAFEPGSTMKVFSVAAALHAGVTRDDEVFDAEKGSFRIGRHVIHDSKPYDKLSLADVIRKSSNICVSKLALRLGPGRLHHALRRFGFGASTQVALRGERSGTLRNPKRWSTVGLANIAFGQGMTTTVLQLARALTAIGNDGKLMQPRIVLRIEDREGRVVRSFEPQGERVISPQLARRMRYLMRGVVQKGGTAEGAALDRYSVAGKTGTAQKVDPLTGTYSDALWYSSFIAVTPAEKPRLAVAVVVNEPSGDEYHGGPVAGPVFKRIASQALRYLGVRPDLAAGAPSRRVAKRAPSRAKPQPEVELAPPLPAGEAPRGRHVVPDFTGMSIAEALATARRSGLSLEIAGSGVAVAQTPGPGPSSQPRCRVAFAPPG